MMYKYYRVSNLNDLHTLDQITNVSEEYFYNIRGYLLREIVIIARVYNNRVVGYNDDNGFYESNHGIKTSDIRQLPRKIIKQL